MRRTINLRRGLNLALKGGLSGSYPVKKVSASSAAVVPADFPGFLPKLDVTEGDTVARGGRLMHHKADPEMCLVSPVAGTVEQIVRGPRRRIERVVVRTGEGGVATLATDAADRDSVSLALRRSGLWAMMRQRPYDIVPDPAATPRDIFVTALDTAPLALSLEAMTAGKKAQIEAGVKALSLLTPGHIFIGVAKGSEMPDIKGAEVIEFTPLHPAGNAGVQADAIAPVNKGEVIWTLDIVTLVRIGTLMLCGEVDTSATVAVTGSETTEPCVVETVAGAPLSEIIGNDLPDDGVHKRIISGNVLTGTPESLTEGYLRYPYRQVTVIPEGDDADEFMGWASMNPSKLSVSSSFPGKLLGRLFSPDARLNGGRRAMIMSGVYDRYIPMDILPEPLVKAILARDIDQMEALGIYEVAPEDFALAEFADPSKLELQKIVREGLDYMRSEA